MIFKRGMSALHFTATISELTLVYTTLDMMESASTVLFTITAEKALCSQHALQSKINGIGCGKGDRWTCQL